MASRRVAAGLRFSLGRVSVTFAAHKPSQCPVARVWVPGPARRVRLGRSSPCALRRGQGGRPRRFGGSEIFRKMDTWEALFTQNRIPSHFEGPLM